VQSERDQLLREKISTLYNVMLTDRILSLGILAAGLGHHLRNAMVAVKTFLDMTPKKLTEENLNLESLRDPDFWKNYYQKVQNQMDKVNTLLSDLWETSELPAAQFPDRVQLHQVIQEAIAGTQGLLDKKSLNVENLTPASLPELRVDAKKFHRLFEFLLREEAANLPVGGKLKFTAKGLGKAEGPEEVEVELTDNGPGLSQDALQSLFNPFFVRSGNPQEFGTYLLTCFFIIYHHGGRIQARSEGKNGNVFTMTLPVNPQVKTISLEERDFISKILINEKLWDKLLSGG
jgi:two-component system probable response regulator PhcQ